ncbi:MAG: hypothetical protein ACRYG7_39645 [Janthinobacterium lividum]
MLSGTPLQVLTAGSRRAVDLLLSTATNEADWWVLNATAAFDPGSIGHLVEELVVKSRIARSRARRIVATYDINGRTPVEVRGPLFTDYFFTLPTSRAALAHAAAGGTAYLLGVGPAAGAPAVHGTEMYGIVGRQKPGASAAQASRDTLVRDALLDFATGQHARLWPAVATEPTAHSITLRPDGARRGSAAHLCRHRTDVAGPDSYVRSLFATRPPRLSAAGSIV